MAAKDAECSTDDKLAKALRDIDVLHERLRNRDTALDLQAREYERRLTDLNHAHAEAAARNVLYVTRDLHDKLENGLFEQIRTLDKSLSDRIGETAIRLTTIEQRSVGRTEIGALATGIAIVVGAVVAIMDHFVLR